MAAKTIENKEPALIMAPTFELVLELKELVRKIETKRHTAKSLKRTMTLIQTVIVEIKDTLEVAG